MPLRLDDPAHGHSAVFHAPSISREHLRDVVWDACSISVPSHSPLNGIADVCLRLPHLRPHRARLWCRRHNVCFVDITPLPLPYSLLRFRVSHFSRYRYIDSDSDDDEGNGDNAQLTEQRDHHPDDISPALSKQTPPLPPPGSTPARPRGRPAAPHAPAATAHARPRMSTRDLGLDMDDTTDPDGSDEMDETEATQPQPVEMSDELPLRTVHPFDDQPPSQPPPPSSNFLSPDPFHSGRRSLTFDDRPQHLPEKTESWKLPQPDVPSLHRLREALFTPAKARAFKNEALPYDVDMADIPLSAQLDPDNNQYEESVDDLLAPDDATPVPEDVAAREADDFEDDDGVVVKFIADGFRKDTLPFPIVEDSVFGRREHLFMDPALANGRSFRISFSQFGELLAPCFHSNRGFLVEMADVHQSPTHRLSRISFCRLLTVHCTVWYQTQVALSNDKDDKDTSRPLQVPSLAQAFQHGPVADGVLMQVVDVLDKIYDPEDDPNVTHAGIVFRMLYALYKSSEQILGREVDGGHGLLLRVTEWGLRGAGTSFDNDDENAVGLRKAVVALSLGKVDDAVEYAIEQGCFRLAMLIARALETPKEGLREDSLQQLHAYGLGRDDEDVDGMTDDIGSKAVSDKGWDHILHKCEADASICVNERMLLLILAGHVAPVARYLRFSWYRAFLLELLHGSSSADEESQWQRIAAAVRAVGRCGISTLAPHGQEGCEDVLYNILRLCASDGEKNFLTPRLYSNSGFGVKHEKMDWRFSWMLHQVLSALIPEASPRGSCAMVSDGFAAQLMGHGMPLWAFYVMCCGGAGDAELKEMLVRNWAEIVSDCVEVVMEEGGMRAGKEIEASEMMEGEMETMSDEFTEAETFLRTVLKVPERWMAEAKAVQARVEGDALEESGQWLACGDERGANRAHRVLMEEVVPGAVVGQDMKTLREVWRRLEGLEEVRCVGNWHSGGGLVLGYLRYVCGVPELEWAQMGELRELVGWTGQYLERWESDVGKWAGIVMADGIVSAQRGTLMRMDGEERERWFMEVVRDLEEIGCSRAVRLRLSGEYMIAAKHGWAAAQRVAAALPGYRKFVKGVKEEET